MKKLVFLLSLLPSLVFSQLYLAPTVGMQSQNVGSCMVNTCSGTYRDNGNNGNYSNNINGVYRHFCPNAAGQCVRLNLDWIDTEAGWDGFNLIDGASQNSPQTGFLSGFANPWGATFTSTDASGCVGIRFWSDGSVTRPGFQMTITCVPGCGVVAGDNNDCTHSTPVCVNTPIVGGSAGPGLTSTCVDCNLSENYSSWYNIQINTAGSFDLTINPTNGTDDYDFVLYQASSCGALGAPIRCSYAAGNNATGMSNAFFDTSEDVNGNSWLDNINFAAAGTEYILMVNDWSGTGGGYTLNWGGTASLDCVVLPVELLSFEGRAYDGYIELNWNVATELSLERYDIEKMINGEWTKILEAQPYGDNSFYTMTDMNPDRGTNYYRLKSMDFNGEYAYSDIINVNYNNEIFDVMITSDKVIIDATDIPIESIELYNVLGQNINNLPLSIVDEGAKYIIDLDQLPKNSYILRINGIEGRMFVKY
jgi:hypothetical protein